MLTLASSLGSCFRGILGSEASTELQLARFFIFEERFDLDRFALVGCAETAIVEACLAAASQTPLCDIRELAAKHLAKRSGLKRFKTERVTSSTIRLVQDGTRDRDLNRWLERVVASEPIRSKRERNVGQVCQQTSQGRYCDGSSVFLELTTCEPTYRGRTQPFSWC